MEQSYLEKHKRVPEIEKVFSLRKLYLKANPSNDWSNGINELKNQGVSFKLSTELFNNDFAIEDTLTRKIKMVQVTTHALGGTY